MRWKHAQEGDRRTVKKFAWLPTELDDGTTVFLEEYLKEEVYGHHCSSMGYGADGWWLDGRKPLEAK